MGSLFCLVCTNSVSSVCLCMLTCLFLIWVLMPTFAHLSLAWGCHCKAAGWLYHLVACRGCHCKAAGWLYHLVACRGCHCKAAGWLYHLVACRGCHCKAAGWLYHLAWGCVTLLARVHGVCVWQLVTLAY